MKSFRDFIPKIIVCLKEGYHKKTFLADLIAGLTVAVIALPLSIALAIASGSTPEKGILTAILAGGLISLLGGSRFQVGGPTGAFVVIIADILARKGTEGLLIATVLGGIFLVLMGAFRLGNWMKMIPLPLIVGVTTAIALYIFTSQVPFFLGLELENNPARFLEKWQAYLPALKNAHPASWIAGSMTLAFGILLKRYAKQIPWGITAIILTTAICQVFHIHAPTLSDKYGALPVTLPLPKLSLSLFNFGTVQDVFFDGVAIALLAGLESLLTAMIADTMTGGRHKPNCELVAQGFANISSGIFGGLPATGAFARTIANVQCGAKTPFAGIFHAIFVLIIVFFFSSFLSIVPLAAFSGMLFLVCFSMADFPMFFEMTKSNAGDRVTLFAAFLLTLFIDLSAGITIGTIIASFAFIKKISEKPLAFEVRKWIEKPSIDSNEQNSIHKVNRESKDSPVFELEGPLFYAVADHLREIWTLVDPETKKLTIDLDRVTYVDATGLQALKDLKRSAKHRGVTIDFINPTKELKKEIKSL